MKYRSDPTTRGKVQRALGGRCFDCYGRGERKNIVDSIVSCPTCNGSGRITEMTPAQVALGASLPVSSTYLALEDLRDEGLASEVSGGRGPERWVPLKSQQKRGDK